VSRLEDHRIFLLHKKDSWNDVATKEALRNRKNLHLISSNLPLKACHSEEENGLQKDMAIWCILFAHDQWLF